MSKKVSSIETKDRNEFVRMYQELIDEGWKEIKHNVGADGVPQPMKINDQWVFDLYVALFEKEEK
ncbi:hypothetical protein QNI16_17755 [Cytophagaceae bacterium YF14B1]|uniref:Uncharacterized protein n=1 Tax=Xanthocytophaga flava TaxID=3048013 RepID=A0AAE3U7F2_9BACT|nr:hypothetical protein [Xanthocytophaga flavus]MDJ1482356.1 hypothetical protein [Xanthocytophaga flavus]